MITGQSALPLTASAVDPMTSSAAPPRPPIPTTNSPASADALSSAGTGCSAEIRVNARTSGSARWATV